MIRAADIAESKFSGHGMLACDPHRKADAENIGHLSGDQSMISETPVAAFGATVESASHQKQWKANFYVDETDTYLHIECVYPFFNTFPIE